MKLIITETKGMADAIAKAAGNFEENTYIYRNDDDTIVWTDDAVVDLAYRPVGYMGDIDDLTAEEIVKHFTRLLSETVLRIIPDLQQWITAISQLWNVSLNCAMKLSLSQPRLMTVSASFRQSWLSFIPIFLVVM